MTLLSEWKSLFLQVKFPNSKNICIDWDKILGKLSNRIKFLFDDLTPPSRASTVPSQIPTPLLAAFFSFDSSTLIFL